MTLFVLVGGFRDHSEVIIMVSRKNKKKAGLMRLTLILIALLGSLVDAQAREIALMIYYFSPNDVNPGSFRSVSNRFRNSFRGHLKNLDVIAIEARNGEELNEALQSLNLGPDDRISRLDITSHGGSTFIGGGLLNGKAVSDGTYTESALIAEESIEQSIYFRFPVERDSNSNLRVQIEEVNRETIKIFQPIRGKFTKGALIHCSACRFIPKPKSQANATAAVIQTVFNITDGGFYGNYTDGLMDARMFLKPFWTATGWKTKASVGLIQTSIPAFVLGGVFLNPYFLPYTVAFPLMYGLAKHCSDKGFEIQFEKGNVAGIKKTRSSLYLRKFSHGADYCESLLGE